MKRGLFLVKGSRVVKATAEERVAAAVRGLRRQVEYLENVVQQYMPPPPAAA